MRSGLSELGIRFTDMYSAAPLSSPARCGLLTASCLHARFWEGKQFKEIAEAEGFTTSAAIVTVRNAIIKLQKYYIKRGWMKPPKEKAICTKTAPPKRNRKKTSAKKS